MASIALIAPVAMATTQFELAISDDGILGCTADMRITQSLLRMSWVVTTGKNGDRRLRLTWEGS